MFCSFFWSIVLNFTLKSYSFSRIVWQPHLIKSCHLLKVSWFRKDFLVSSNSFIKRTIDFVHSTEFVRSLLGGIVGLKKPFWICLTFNTFQCCILHFRRCLDSLTSFIFGKSTFRNIFFYSLQSMKAKIWIMVYDFKSGSQSINFAPSWAKWSSILLCTGVSIFHLGNS